MSEFVQFEIRELNSLLTCKLCDGYYQDAHTIPECMHTFCKDCITNYFSEAGLKSTIYCPTCKTDIGYYHMAIEKIIFDRNIQSIVDKIFPPERSKGEEQEQAEDQDDKFMMKVVPYSVDGSHSLPILAKSAFKASLDIKISKILTFIFKRLPEDIKSSLEKGSEDIEVLYNQQVLLPSSDLNPYKDLIFNSSDKAASITLQYRRISPALENSIS